MHPTLQAIGATYLERATSTPPPPLDDTAQWNGFHTSNYPLLYTSLATILATKLNLPAIWKQQLPFPTIWPDGIGHAPAREKKMECADASYNLASHALHSPPNPDDHVLFHIHFTDTEVFLFGS